MAERSDWKRVTSGPNRNTISYVNQSGEKISRRQYEKRFKPQKYEKYYASERKATRKFEIFIPAKHDSRQRIYNVRSFSAVEDVLRHNRGTTQALNVRVIALGKSSPNNPFTEARSTAAWVASGKYVENVLTDLQRVMDQYSRDFKIITGYQVVWTQQLTKREQQQQRNKAAKAAKVGRRPR